jgi:hypothetical protein
VQKIGLFGLLHSYCVIMHTCVLMFAFPFWWPSFMHLFDVCVCGQRQPGKWDDKDGCSIISFA